MQAITCTRYNYVQSKIHFEFKKGIGIIIISKQVRKAGEWKTRNVGSTRNKLIFAT